MNTQMNIHYPLRAERYKAMKEQLSYPAVGVQEVAVMSGKKGWDRPAEVTHTSFKTVPDSCINNRSSPN